jgi:hypothetical protein
MEQESERKRKREPESEEQSPRSPKHRTEEVEKRKPSTEEIRALVEKYEKFNPDFSIIKVTTEKGKDFFVVDDGKLEGGTKQRGVVPFLKLFLKSTTKDAVIVTTPQGYAQIAVSIGCKEVGLKAHVFLNRTLIKGKAVIEPLTQVAIRHGAEIHFVDSPSGRIATLAETKQAANNFVASRKDCELIPFGLNDPLFEQILSEAISLKFPQSVHSPKNIWCVVGSGAIIHSLYKAFPQCKFHAVRVGKEIDWVINKENTSYHDATLFEKFWEEAKILPPYQSVTRYDAKLWRFAIMTEQNGDFIWNVGKDVPLEYKEDENFVSNWNPTMNRDTQWRKNK